MKHNAEYDGHQCISFRDEPWFSIEAEIQEAYLDGWHYILIDDGVVLFREDDRPQEAELMSSLRELTATAHEDWWR